MDEKIANIIKKIRYDYNLTQRDLAEKLNVSYQAVSKWERGLNIPDIDTLRLISEMFDIDFNEFLLNKKSKKVKKRNNKVLIIVILLLITLIISLFIYNKSNNDFHFKTISSTCKDYKISGSLAYSKDLSYIYISDISYCGSDEDKSYKSIECLLYKTEDDMNIKVASYDKKNNISLKEYLENIKFNLDSKDNNCKLLSNTSLTLVIKTTDDNNLVNTNEIPLELNDTCNK